MKPISVSGMLGMYATTRSPLLHPEPLQPGPDAAGLLDQLAEGQLARPARLRARHDRDPVAVLLEADEVLGVVEPRAGEPLRSGHLPLAQHALVAASARMP